MFYRCILLYSALFICAITVVEAKDPDSILIYQDSIDVTGDGIKEAIYLKGEPLSSSSTYFPFIHATILSQNGNEWTIDLPGGFNPKVEYIDVTNNGINELLYQSSFSSYEDIYTLKIYTFENDQFTSVPIPTESFVHGKFIDNFLVHMFIHPHQNPIVLDIKEDASAYIAAGIYNKNGKLLRQQDVFIEPIHSINASTSDQQTMIKTTQRASSMIEAKELGTLQSTWIFEEGSWRLLDTSWTNHK